MGATVLLLVLAALAATTQEKRDPLPKRGETVLVTGCVSRGRIESHEMKVRDREASYDRFVTFRLTGDKKVLDDLKKEHDGHVEILTAVLKSELPVEGQQRTIGNTRIGIGLPGRNEPQGPPSLPVLEVKSAEHTAKSCR